MSDRRLTVTIDCQSATFDILQALKFKNGGQEYAEVFVLALTHYAKNRLGQDHINEILAKHGKL